jgi:hypothetical protein
LTADGREQGIGTFLANDFLDVSEGEWLDIGSVGDLRVGHDGSRVGVDQDHFVALALEGLTGLGAGIIELAGLADNDGPGADDHDRGDVGSFRHVVPLAARARKKKAAFPAFWTGIASRMPFSRASSGRARLESCGLSRRERGRGEGAAQMRGRLAHMRYIRQAVGAGHFLPKLGIAAFVRQFVLALSAYHLILICHA